jgi:hypothetical protein
MRDDLYKANTYDTDPSASHRPIRWLFPVSKDDIYKNLALKVTIPCVMISTKPIPMMRILPQVIDPFIDSSPYRKMIYIKIEQRWKSPSHAWWSLQSQYLWCESFRKSSTHSLTLPHVERSWVYSTTYSNPPFPYPLFTNLMNNLSILGTNSCVS